MISGNDSKIILRVFFPCDNYAVFVTLKVQSGWGSAPDPDGRCIQVPLPVASPPPPPPPLVPGSVLAMQYYIDQLIRFQPLILKLELE